jgi:cytochrome c oxidase subunit 4
MGHNNNFHGELMITQDHSTELGHTQPIGIYFNVFFSLLILTVITVAVSYIDFGVFDLVVAMGIASVKATLVAMYFMHLKYENPFTLIYALIPILLLFFLIGGVFLDSPMRTDPPFKIEQTVK